MKVYIAFEIVVMTLLSCAGNIQTPSPFKVVGTWKLINGIVLTEILRNTNISSVRAELTILSQNFFIHIRNYYGHFKKIRIAV
jgi:hypothetical protein